MRLLRTNLTSSCGVERFKIFEMECVRLRRECRAFHIDDFDDLTWNTLQRTFATGFQQNIVSRLEQSLHQGNDFALLQHWLAAGDLDQSAPD